MLNAWRIDKHRERPSVPVGAAGQGSTCSQRSQSKKSVNCHRGTRESFFGFKQAPSSVSFLCQSVTDFDRFSVRNWHKENSYKEISLYISITYVISFLFACQVYDSWQIFVHAWLPERAKSVSCSRKSVMNLSPIWQIFCHSTPWLDRGDQVIWRPCPSGLTAFTSENPWLAKYLFSPVFSMACSRWTSSE